MNREMHQQRSAPRRNFAFPHEVLEDPSLGLSEKRAILSEWASDACAVESFPALRLLPGTNFPVTFSAIMDARRQLDKSVEHRETPVGCAREALGRVILADFANRRSSPPRAGR